MKIVGMIPVFNEKDNQFIIPKKLGVSKKTVEAFIEGSLDTPSLESLGVDPARYNWGRAEKLSREDMYEAINESGFWASNDNQDGIILMFRDLDENIPVENSQGQRIDVKFIEMQEDQRVLDNLNSFF